MSVPEDEIEAFMDEHDMNDDKAKWISRAISNRLEVVNIYVDEYELREQLLDTVEEYDTSLPKAGLAFEIKKLNENGLTIEHVPKAERRMFDYDAEIDVDADNLTEGEQQEIQFESINEDDSTGDTKDEQPASEHPPSPTAGESASEITTDETDSEDVENASEVSTDEINEDIGPVEFFTREQNREGYGATYDGRVNPDGPFVETAQRRNRPTSVKVKLKVASYRDAVKTKVARYRDALKQLFNDKRV